MRPKSLSHPLVERHSRRHRPKRHAGRRVGRRVGRMAMLAHKPRVKPAISAHAPRDIAVERVRAAGGPLDRASYTCECGFIFAAPVSTSVACPHCGTNQAW